MSAVLGHGSEEEDARSAGSAAMAIAAGAGERVLAFDRDGEGSGKIVLAKFLDQVRGVAAALPPARHAINLCENRYRFLVALCAAAVRGQTTLLPPSRAPGVIAGVRQAYPDSVCIGEAGAAPPDAWILPERLPERDGAMPRVDESALAVIGFTSGSTGAPVANPKTWRSFRIGTAQNLAALRHLWPAGETAHVVATVPPQHMYGMEYSVLLPLFGPAAVHTGRPFFPSDVAAALAQAPANRLLVTTPVHLRALVESELTLPPLAGIVSATAPLTAELAASAEARFGCEVREVFGSTETCVIAHRRTAREQAWTPYPGVSLTPQPDGTLVRAPHLAAPVRLADIVELHSDGVHGDGMRVDGVRVDGMHGDGMRSNGVHSNVRFELRGRNADLLEIAGKRASLGDLTRRLQAVPGVIDGVVFQLDEENHGVRRIAALAVAPGLDEDAILQALRDSVDPVFLPRPLRCVHALPRNDTGKLPRAALLALLRGNMT
jgi:acyl-coenzyme A synthetase/AMP-(fatty) acid ligase